MELCERFRDPIGSGKSNGAPEIYVRYAVRDTMFHVAKFCDFFFFENKMYVFSKDSTWKPYHDEFAVMACFGHDCKAHGYAHEVTFCGIQTPFKDDQGAPIFTGDICEVDECDGSMTYRVVTSNIYEGYGFAADNVMLLLNRYEHPLHRVGTIFYIMEHNAPVVSTWKKGSEICNMWGQALDIEKKLSMAKLTPSFMQDDLEYLVISKLTEEYDWRIIFDEKYALPDKRTKR